MVCTGYLVDQNIDAYFKSFLVDVLFIGLSRSNLRIDQRSADEIPRLRQELSLVRNLASHVNGVRLLHVC